MSILKKLAFGLIGTVALGSSVAPALAATAEYISPVSAPPIVATNSVFDSGHWVIGTTNAGTVNNIAWQIYYTSTAIQVRVCQVGYSACTPWSTTHSGTSTIFTGHNVQNAFYFEAKDVVAPTNISKPLSPPLYGNGNSMIDVYYTY